MRQPGTLASRVPAASWQRAQRSLSPVAGVLLCRHAQLLQLRGDVGAMGSRLDLFIDVQNLAIRSNVEGPPFGHWASLVDNAIGFRRFLARITEDRVVELERGGVTLVRFGRVAARGEEGRLVGVDSGPLGGGEFHFLAVEERNGERLFEFAGTQRIAFAGSTASKRFGEPGDNHMLAPEFL